MSASQRVYGVDAAQPARVRVMRTTAVTKKDHRFLPLPLISWIFMPNIDVARLSGINIKANTVTSSAVSALVYIVAGLSIPILTMAC